MDGLEAITWVTKLPTSSMEHHIDTFGVGMRINEIPDDLGGWIKDTMQDDSARINERQLDRMHNDNCDADVCSRCGSPEARLIGTTQSSVKLTASLAQGILSLPDAPNWLRNQAKDRLKEEAEYKQAMAEYDPDEDEHKPTAPIDNSIDSPSNSEAMLCNECCTMQYEREFDTFVTRDPVKIREAAKLGIKAQSPRTIGGESPSQLEWLGFASNQTQVFYST